MSIKKILLLSLPVAMLAWALFSWPLARHVASGIPASATNVEKGHVRQMVMGDHLQLLYNYWIFSDMLSGKTRMFHNLYEFNTGNDDERRYFGFDFMPLTLVFTLAYWMGGAAFAWNITAIFTLWVGLFFSWLLARRYVRDGTAAFAASLIAVSMPYLWAVQLGGSPTGFAMAFVPMMLWGIDTAIRDGALIGGLVAALSLLCSFLNDAHILLFSFLAAPCWAAFVLWQAEEKPWLDGKRWRSMVVAMLPLALTAIFIMAVIQLGKGATEGTTIESGRGAHEVAIFTPDPRGLFSWDSREISHSIYIGFMLPIMLVAGLLAQAYSLFKDPRREWRRTLSLLAIIVGGWLLVALALGPNGPDGGRVFDMARHWIPNYDMIRQPAKIFAMLPVILVVGVALAFSALLRLVPSRWKSVAVAIPMLLLVLEYRSRIDPTICLLDDSQGAYQAVLNDAQADGGDARAIAIPIWPGDSAWSSLYEYYGMLYRIRMINGYQPVVSKEYIENIYHAFEYLNGGIVTDEQLDGLLSRGIDHLILHEDAFPEQVSSFAVSFTLKSFLDSPRLKLLKQSENIWAFKITQASPANITRTPDWNIFFPSYNSNIELEWFSQTNAVVENCEACSGDRAVTLANENAAVTLDPFYHCDATNAVILLRGRGHGEMNAELTLDNGRNNSYSLNWNNDDWQWREIWLKDLNNSITGQLRFMRKSGSFSLDDMILSSGSLLGIKPGEEVSLPAPLFFHAGYTDLKENSVVVRALHESSGVILYGPNLPLPAGDYIVGMQFVSKAKPGTELGSFTVTCGASSKGPVKVVAGNSPATVEFSVPQKNLPLRFGFQYSRKADMRILSISFKRMR